MRLPPIFVREGLEVFNFSAGRRHRCFPLLTLSSSAHAILLGSIRWVVHSDSCPQRLLLCVRPCISSPVFTCPFLSSSHAHATTHCLLAGGDLILVGIGPGDKHGDRGLPHELQVAGRSLHRRCFSGRIHHICSTSFRNNKFPALHDSVRNPPSAPLFLSAHSCRYPRFAEPSTVLFLFLARLSISTYMREFIDSSISSLRSARSII